MRAGSSRCLPGAPPTRLVVSRHGREVSVPLSIHGDGSHRFSLELPAEEFSSTEPGERGWALRVVSSDGADPIAWPEDSPDAWLGSGTTSELAFHRTARGNTLLMEVRGLAQLEGASLDGTTLTVRGSWLGVPLDGWSLVLQGPRTRVLGTLSGQDDGGRFTVDVPLVWDEWGLGSTCVPVGLYRVVLTPGGPAARGRPARADGRDSTGAGAADRAAQRRLSRAAEQGCGRAAARGAAQAVRRRRAAGLLPAGAAHGLPGQLAAARRERCLPPVLHRA